MYVQWRFKRNENMHVITAIGECYDIEQENVVVAMAVFMILLAKKYQGVPCLGGFAESYRVPVVVSFTLIFPSDDEIEAYLADISDIFA